MEPFPFIVTIKPSLVATGTNLSLRAARSNMCARKRCSYGSQSCGENCNRCGDDDPQRCWDGDIVSACRDPILWIPVIAEPVENLTHTPESDLGFIVRSGADEPANPMAFYEAGSPITVANQLAHIERTFEYLSINLATPKLAWFNAAFQLTTSGGFTGTTAGIVGYATIFESTNPALFWRLKDVSILQTLGGGVVVASAEPWIVGNNPPFVMGSPALAGTSAVLQFDDRPDPLFPLDTMRQIRVRLILNGPLPSGANIFSIRFANQLQPLGIVELPPPMLDA